jgi:GSH-dependent disulfide-bond oxidoreductase
MTPFWLAAAIFLPAFISSSEVTMIDLHTVATANGQKVQIVLAETGTPYNLHMVDMVAGQHKSAEFRKLNPFGKAPVLIDSDGPDGKPIIVAETMAQAWYVAEKAGGALLPGTMRERTEYNVLAAAISSSVAMPFSMQYTAKFLAPEPTPWLLDRMTAACHEAIGGLQALLGDRPYALGERFSLADCLLYPVLATSAKRLDGWLEPYPKLADYVARVGTRPGVIAGMTAC